MSGLTLSQCVQIGVAKARRLERIYGHVSTAGLARIAKKIIRDDLGGESPPRSLWVPLVEHIRTELNNERQRHGDGESTSG